MPNVPFQQLQALLALARTGSFIGAANELGISRSAVSQSIRTLEAQLSVVLVARTTRSVSLTDAGRRLVAAVAPAVAQTISALADVAAQPGEVVGRLRFTVPRSAMPQLERVLPTFCARNPRIEIELVFEDRRVDLVAEGYDAGVRLDEYVEKDMVALRLTDAFNFIVVGSPTYFAQRGRPETPEDLHDHECITFRSATTGALYAWELERGRKTWKIAVRGNLVVNDGLACTSLAEQGLGLAYAMEPLIQDQLRTGALEQVLEPYTAKVPGWFLFFPSRAQRTPALTRFVETVQELMKSDDRPRRKKD